MSLIQKIRHKKTSPNDLGIKEANKNFKSKLSSLKLRDSKNLRLDLEPNSFNQNEKNFKKKIIRTEILDTLGSIKTLKEFIEERKKYKTSNSFKKKIIKYYKSSNNNESGNFEFFKDCKKMMRGISKSKSNNKNNNKIKNIEKINCVSGSKKEYKKKIVVKKTEKLIKKCEKLRRKIKEISIGFNNKHKNICKSDRAQSTSCKIKLQKFNIEDNNNCQDKDNFLNNRIYKNRKNITHRNQLKPISFNYFNLNNDSGIDSSIDKINHNNNIYFTKNNFFFKTLGGIINGKNFTNYSKDKINKNLIQFNKFKTVDIKTGCFNESKNKFAKNEIKKKKNMKYKKRTKTDLDSLKKGIIKNIEYLKKENKENINLVNNPNLKNSFEIPAISEPKGIYKLNSNSNLTIYKKRNNIRIRNSERKIKDLSYSKPSKNIIKDNTRNTFNKTSNENILSLSMLGNKNNIPNTISSTSFIPPLTPLTKDNSFTGRELITKKIMKIDSCTIAGYSSPGIQKTNQDNLFIKKEFLDDSEQFFIGICDGHGVNGHFVSEYITNLLPKVVKDTSDEAIINGFKLVNNSLVSKSKIDCSMSGSTCISLVISLDKIICANLGDSRAVLARYENGVYNAFNLSRDHKPNQPEEMKRIFSKGGRIKPYYDEDLKQLIGPDRVWLKNMDIPGLAMSRSIGDNIAHLVGVIPEPEIKRFEFFGTEKFIVLASDGIWEYIDSDECVNIVKDFYEKDMDAIGALNTLVKEAFNRWKKEDDTIDDITAIVIFFE